MAKEEKEDGDSGAIEMVAVTDEEQDVSQS